MRQARRRTRIASAVVAALLLLGAGAILADERAYSWTLRTGMVMGPRNIMAYMAWGRRIYGEIGRFLADCGICYNNTSSAIAFVLQRFQTELDAMTERLRKNPASRATRADLAYTLLQLGRYEDAVREYMEILEVAPDDRESLFFAGVTHLRNANYPLAEQFLKRALRRRDDLTTRWLIHVAGRNMRRGEAGSTFPFRAAAGPPGLAFTDVALAAGVAKVAANKAVALGDFDGDGRIDILTGGSFASISFFRNNGDGTFTDVAPGALLGTMTDVFEMVPADYDNDGDLDVFVTRGGPVKAGMTTLLKNMGDGSFQDATDEAGVRVMGVSTFTAAWGDYDNDGDLDLYVTTVATRPWRIGIPVFKPVRNLLFRNNGDGTFTEVGHEAGVDTPFSSYGASWGDYNDDGCLDLYVSNLMGPNHLYRNNCNGTFTDTARAAGVEMPWTSFVSWFWDYDNDGKLDIFSTDYALFEDVLRGIAAGSGPPELTMRLYRNRGDGTFADVTAAAGLSQPWGSMGGNYGDLDSDGHLDFCLGNGGPDMWRIEPSICYRNNGDGTFTNITFTTGLLNMGKGHGVAFGDLFDDGVQEMYLAIGGIWPGDVWPNAAFRLTGDSRPNWITVRTRGVKSNRDGIGARIRVAAGDLSQVREVTGGSGFGASTLQQEFGLGRRTRIDELEVIWPASGTRQRFTDVPINRIIEVTEFAETYRIAPRRVAMRPLAPGELDPWEVKRIPPAADQAVGGRLKVEHVHASTR